VIALRLRTRLTIWFAASILLILLPFLIGIAALEWRSMRASLDHHLQEDLEVALEMLVIRGVDVVWRTEATRDLGYDAGEQRWLEVYGAGGQPLFFRGLVRQPGIRAALPAPSAGTPGYRSLRTPAGAHVRTLTAERRLGTTLVRMRVARTEDDLRRELRLLVWVFALVAPLAVLAAALAGYLISGRALAPLGRMAAQAHTISAENLSERLPVDNAKDELGQLAFVFNEMFARLQESFERMKRFSADASHELRTPLTAIRSVGEVALREAREPRDYQDVIGSMLEESDRLARLVDTLLTLSRWESGRLRLCPVALDLGDLARDVAGQLAVLAEDRGITVDVAISTPLSVTVDPVVIRQAVMNVVDNAIKFAPEGGRVRIRATSTGGAHALVVDDDGPGIPLKDRARVLERFYRVEGSPAQATTGSGLGLAIVAWAIEAHHGHLAIDASESGGARVVMALPRTPHAAPSA
jgi:heavy metal sensor kinase